MSVQTGPGKRMDDEDTRDERDITRSMPYQDKVWVIEMTFSKGVETTRHLEERMYGSMSEMKQMDFVEGLTTHRAPQGKSASLAVWGTDKELVARTFGERRANLITNFDRLIEEANRNAFRK